MNDFEQHFISEIRRLHLLKKDILESLEITLPTLNSKIKDHGRFTVDEILKLKKLNINLKKFNL